MIATAYLADTNILLRIARRDEPDHHIVDGALAKLFGFQVALCYTHQNLAEFWNVCTRPVDRNGFGLSIEAAELESKNIERAMVFLPDSEAVYHKWRQLIVEYRVSGLRVHDARLVASMLVHNISHLLTLNAQDFQRYTRLITAVHPRNLLDE
jgi:predicted nucleic acid-binding protein